MANQKEEGCPPASEEAVKWLQDMGPFAGIVMLVIIDKLESEGVCKNCALNQLYEEYLQFVATMDRSSTVH